MNWIVSGGWRRPGVEQPVCAHRRRHRDRVERLLKAQYMAAESFVRNGTCRPYLNQDPAGAVGPGISITHLRRIARGGGVRSPGMAPNELELRLTARPRRGYRGCNDCAPCSRSSLSRRRCRSSPTKDRPVVLRWERQRRGWRRYWARDPASWIAN